MRRCLPSCSLRPGARQVKAGIKIPLKKKKKRAERGGWKRCSSLPRATDGNIEGHLNVTSIYTYIYIYIYISKTTPTGAAVGRGKESGDEHRGAMGRTDRTSPRRGGAPTAPTAPAPGCQHPTPPPPPPQPRIPAAGFQHRGDVGGAQRCDLLYTRVFFLVRLCVRCRGLIENGVGEKGWGVGGVSEKQERHLLE